MPAPEVEALVGAEVVLLFLSNAAYDNLAPIAGGAATLEQGDAAAEGTGAML